MGCQRKRLLMPVDNFKIFSVLISLGPPGTLPKGPWELPGTSTKPTFFK